MNPNNWLTSRGGFPAGGSTIWQGNNLAGQLLRNEFFGAASDAGYINYWNNLAWVRKPIKYWNGTAWLVKPLKRWNGTTWMLT